MLVLPGPEVLRTGGGQQKTPHAGGVAVLSERLRSARPLKQEPPGHATEPTATSSARSPGPPHPAGRNRSLGAGSTTPPDRGGQAPGSPYSPRSSAATSASRARASGGSTTSSPAP